MKLNEIEMMMIKRKAARASNLSQELCNKYYDQINEFFSPFILDGGDIAVFVKQLSDLIAHEVTDMPTMVKGMIVLEICVNMIRLGTEFIAAENKKMQNG